MRIDDGTTNADASDDDTAVLSNDETRVSASSSDTAILSNVTIQKAAEVIASLSNTMPHAVRAVQYKSEGNKFVVDGRYQDALECYTRGRVELCWQHHHETRDDDNSDDCSPAASSSLLASSLWLCCARSRLLQFESSSESHNDETTTNDDDDDDDDDERIDLLRQTAGDALRILSRSSTQNNVTIDNGSNSNTSTTIHGLIQDVIAKLVQCSAALDTTRTYFSPPSSEIITLPDGREESVPLTNDIKLLSSFCVVLADAWSGLAILLANSNNTMTTTTVNNNHDTIFSDGALDAYRGALAIDDANTTRVRIFRAKERRRIETALATLVSS